MSGEFVDTNVLIYAHDTSAGAKRRTALALLDRLMAERRGMLSVQVLMEFLVNVTRKIPRPLPWESAVAIVDDFRLWSKFSPAVDDVIAAAGIADRCRISFWDAMIVRSAEVLGASVIWSEDLNPGQRYEGVPVNNPFGERPDAQET